MPINSCEGIPPTNREEIEISQTCVPLFTTIWLVGKGFDDDYAGVYATMPNGEVFGAPFDVPLNFRGDTPRIYLELDDQTPHYGIWTITLEGTHTHRKIFAYFKLVPQGTPVP